MKVSIAFTSFVLDGRNTDVCVKENQIRMVMSSFQMPEFTAVDATKLAREVAVVP